VVLVHGSMDRSASFAKVQRRLDGCHVVRYDRRGYGRSVHLGAAPSIETQIDDLLEVLNGRRGVLVGHSLGGVITLATAQRHPDQAAAVVAYESPMPWTDWWPSGTAGGAVADITDPGDAAETFMRRMIGDEQWERLPPATRAERRAEGPALVAELRSLRRPEPAPYDPALITVPVVVGRGTESKAHHRDTAEALARGVPGAELHIIEGAGHGAHASHSEAFAGLIRRALELSAS
jgi:pimeloyl-ACP methyl ester carboxylesterase